MTKKEIGACKRHEHHGRSSKEFLNAESILRDIGLAKGDVFLDLGSGTGHFSTAASAFVGGGGKVYAFDLDPESIEVLSREISEKGMDNIEAKVVDISGELPLASGSVSVAFMSNVLHGLVANGEEEKALEEIARVTGKGGRFVVVEFKKEESEIGPPLAIRLSPQDVEELASGHGFRRERIQETGAHHYFMIFKKRGSKPQD